jgi:hypothetical protein
MFVSVLSLWGALSDEKTGLLFVSSKSMLRMYIKK